VVACEEWDGPAAAFDVTLDELEPAVAAAELYARGRRALARGDLEGARLVLASLAPRRGALDTLPEGASVAQCCSTTGDGDYLPGRLAARVMELELSGLVALASGAEEEGLTLLQSAAEREDTIAADFGPPDVVEPAHELLGLELAARGREAEAAAEFTAALRRAPGRARSLAGLARCAVAGTTAAR